MHQQQHHQKKEMQKKNNVNIGSSVLHFFPKIKLSYETFVHKKVDDADDADVVIIIPQGIKCFIWFNRGQCHLIEHNKENNEMTIIRTIAMTTNCGNTVFYGTLFQERFVAIHDVLYYKGKPIYTQERTFSNIVKILTEVFLHLCTFKTLSSGAVMSERGDADCAFQMRNGVQGFAEAHKKNSTILFGLPMMVDRKNQDSEFPVLSYVVESYQYRYYDKTLIYKLRMLNSQTEKSYERVKYSNSNTIIANGINGTNPNSTNGNGTRENKVKFVTEKNRTFKVVPDIQNDIYHLYDVNKDTKEEILFDVAYIPDYKTSVMMNYLFRNIKENGNLDTLEESDSDEEFENVNIDKFVHLDRHKNMICQYNYKFKKWTPIKLSG